LLGLFFISPVSFSELCIALLSSSAGVTCAQLNKEGIMVDQEKQQDGQQNGGFSIWKPIEKGIATVSGGYYAATYIPDDHGQQLTLSRLSSITVH
jgi:hypothetical protein